MKWHTLKEQSLPDEAATIRLANELAPLAEPGLKILLKGPLGAGKTFFTRYFLRSLGAEGFIPSPTFTLINDYQVKIKGKVITAHHVDLYRLNSNDDLVDIGLENYLSDESLVLIEWGERFSLLADYVRWEIAIRMETTLLRSVCVKVRN